LTAGQIEIAYLRSYFIYLAKIMVFLPAT